jgi:hypothetical protein
MSFESDRMYSQLKTQNSKRRFTFDSYLAASLGAFC